MINEVVLIGRLSENEQPSELERTIQKAFSQLLKLEAEFDRMFPKLSALEESNKTYYFVRQVGMRLLEDAKEEADEGENIEQEILAEADQTIKICQAKVSLKKKRDKGNQPDFEWITTLGLLGALYASFELGAGVKFSFIELVNPFGWYCQAVDFLEWKDSAQDTADRKARRKAGRRRLIDSPVKLQVVAKVLAENPKATDSTLIAKLSLVAADITPNNRALAPTTARAWLKAYRSLSEEEQQALMQK